MTSGGCVAAKRTLAEEIGGLLYDARTARRGSQRGRSQSELARDSGVPQQRISQIEKGEFDAGVIEQLQALARALGTTLSALLPEEMVHAISDASQGKGRTPEGTMLGTAPTVPPAKTRRRNSSS